MGNTASKISKADDGIGKHDSTDSKTPLVISVPYSNLPDAEKDSIRGALRQLSTRTHVANEDAIGAVPPATPILDTPVFVDEMEGHSNVSRPPSSPVQPLRLSTILNADDIPEFGHVRSPSGNLLDRAQYLAHPNRPLTIPERQEKIRQRLRELEKTGQVADGTAQEIAEKIKIEPGGLSTVGNEKKISKKTKRSKRSWFCCC